MGDVGIGARIGNACVQRCDPGQDQPFTLEEAMRQVEHPLQGLNRDALTAVVAYLSCQVVGLQHRRSASAELALAQITRICRDRAEAVARGAP